MYLATTGFKEVWNFDDEIRYLGSWCFIPDRMNEYQAKKNLTLENPWKNEAYFDQTAKYLDALNERLLLFCVEFLNDFHDTNYDAKFWRILIGKWLADYTARVLDKYICIVNAYDKYPDIYTTSLDIQTALSFDGSDMSAYPRRHLPKLKDYSFIVNELGLKSDILIVDDDFINSIQNSKTSIVKENKIELPINLGNILFGWMHCQKSMLNLLQEKLHGIDVTNFDTPNLDLLLPQKDFLKNYDKRNIFLEFDAKSSFEKLLSKKLIRDFPSDYIENFKNTFEFVKENYLGAPKMIVSALGWYESKTFKFISAISYLKAAKLVSFQHGSIYGLYKNLPNMQHEKAISNTFFSWGWGYDENDKKIKDVPCVHTSYYLENKLNDYHERDNGSILYLVNQVVPYLQDFRSAIKSRGSDDYIDWQVRFFNSLDKELRKKILYRYKKDRNIDVWKWVLEMFPEIDYEGRLIPFPERAKDARIIVADCCTQVYTEAMMMKPTVLFWDPSVWTLSKSTEPYLNALIKNNILFLNPEDAADWVAKIYDSPLSWWNDKNVQKAKNDFLNHYAKPDADWLNKWLNAIIDEYETPIK